MENKENTKFYIGDTPINLCDSSKVEVIKKDTEHEDWNSDFNITDFNITWSIVNPKKNLFETLFGYTKREMYMLKYLKRGRSYRKSRKRKQYVRFFRRFYKVN
jgi:hypothetical protein